MLIFDRRGVFVAIEQRPLFPISEGENMSIGAIKENVSRLSVKERAALARWIIENLELTLEGEGAVDAAWRQEVRQRVEDIRSGKVHMIPAEKVWRDILGNYARTS